MRMATMPDIRYAPGVEDVIRDHMRSGGRIALAAMHTSNWDTPLIASLATEPVFGGLRANTFIPAKPAVFKFPVVREFLRAMGAIPVWRQNLRDMKHNPDNELRKAAAQAYIDLSRLLMNQGKNAASFPGGERDKSDPTKVGELKTGLARTLLGVTEFEVMTLPVATAHFPQRFSPNDHVVRIGMPIEHDIVTEEDVLPFTEAVKNGIQDELTEIFSHVSRPS